MADGQSQTNGAPVCGSRSAQSANTRGPIFAYTHTKTHITYRWGEIIDSDDLVHGQWTRNMEGMGPESEEAGSKKFDVAVVVADIGR